MAWSNYAMICRLCMQHDGVLVGIFNDHMNKGTDRSILKKIIDFTALEVSSGDGLPPCVCHRCLYKVELCLDFKQQCLMSDATLRQQNYSVLCNSATENRNGRLVSDDQECEDVSYKSTTVSVDQFEQFTNANQKFIPDDGQNVENVVMVVNPDLEYDSDNESEYEHHSDVENIDASEFTELKNVFMCKYCDRAYIEKDACRRHEMSEHNTDVPFMCSQCDMAFGDRTNYTAHLKSVHQNDKPFGCPQCPRSFSRRSDLRKHTVVHTGIKPFTCNICYKSFSRNTNLTKHQRIHSGQKPYICPQCPKTFISKGDLTRHALIHSGIKPFACNYCDQSFGRRDKLLRHEKRHFPHSSGEDRSSAISELELLRQQIALSGYTYESSVKQELEPEEEPEEEVEEGGWTGESMVISVDPFNHEENYTNATDKDDRRRSADESLDRDLPRIPDHIENPENELRRIPDHITGDDTPFVEYNKVKSQMETVSAMKKYPCLVCHKRFSSAESLRFHSATHTVSKPHVCSQCSKSFLRKRELDRHMATHTGMKPFKCTDCDKRFGRKDKLVRHMRIHSGNSGNVCAICGASFARKDSLLIHMKTHAASAEEPSVQ